MTGPIDSGRREAIRWFVLMVLGYVLALALAFAFLTRECPTLQENAGDLQRAERERQ